MVSKEIKFGTIFGTAKIQLPFRLKKPNRRRRISKNQRNPRGAPVLRNKQTFSGFEMKRQLSKALGRNRPF